MKKIYYVSFIVLFFQSFHVCGQFVLDNDASVAVPECPAAATTYQLTPNLTNQDGQVWNTTPINLNNRFDVQFQIFMGTKSYSVGADGMAFVFQTLSNNAGSPGGGLGYQGITPSLAVEFDTYQNGWDPPFCHTAIEKNGDIDHTDGSGNNLAGPTQLSPTNPNLPDGAWHEIEIIWNPSDDSLSVYFDCAFRVGYKGDIVDSIFSGNPSVYWGFTGGTGAADNKQEICVTDPYIYSLRDTSVCIGDSVHLTVSGGVSYSWSPSIGLSADTGASIYASPDTTTTYTVSIENSCGLINKDSVTIRVDSIPKITMGAPTDLLCHGINTGSASVTASGAGPYLYLWRAGGQTNATASGLGAGTYTVTVTNNASGCSASASVTITQPTMLTPVITYTSATCGNSNGIAEVTVSGGTSPYTYLWRPGSNTNTKDSGLSAGFDTIKVTDKNGCTASARVDIMQYFTSVTVNSITEISCFGGSNGTATAHASGGISPYSYSWAHIGGTGATGTGLTAGSYTVTVTDSNGCTATAGVTLTQPTIVTAAISATSNVLCHGGTGTATVTAGGGTSPYGYVWANRGGTNATGTGLTAGSYTVTVTDHNNCTATATATITEPTLLTDSITATVHAACNLPTGKATVTGHGGTGPYAYSWSPGNQSTAQATGLSVGTYTVTVTDHNGCTSSITASITQPSQVTATITSTQGVGCFNGGNGKATVTAAGGTTPYTYLWSPGGNTNSSAAGLFALGYTVTVTDANGCTVTASTTITEPPQLSVNITEPKLICKDSTGNLVAISNGGTSPYKYTWSGGVTSTTSTATITPTVTRYFSVEVTDANGCTATGQITLAYGPSVAVEIKGKNSVCAGDSTTLCAYGSGGMGEDTYLWEPENTTNGCITVNPGASSVYTVTVVDGCGATTTASETVSTVPSPVINMYANFYQGCEPLCVQFHNGTSISAGGIQQYVWNFGNGDTSHAANPVYCYPKAGSYNITLTAVSDSGCSTTHEKSGLINVYTKPQAAFTYSPDPVTIVTPEVSFTDESRDAYGIAFRWWNFGESGDTESNLANPVHVYKDTGNYCASLVVMNNHGCTDTATNCLVMEPAFTLYIPSAFTPNGDGLNETFRPKGKYIESFEMYIFDRWGMQIYHSTDINQGWDGKVHGSADISQEDVYVYKITVTDSEGNQHSYIGNVTVLK